MPTDVRRSGSRLQPVIGANRWRFKTYAETPGEEAWYVPPYYRKSGSKRGNRSHLVPCGQKIKLQERRAVIPSRRSLAACRPLGFLGRLRAPSRIGGHTRGTYGVGTYPGLHYGDGGP